MSDFKARFIMNFIKDDRWHYIADGLKVTLIVTFCAVLIGVVLGFLLAIVRSTYDKTGKLKLLNLICHHGHPWYTGCCTAAYHLLCNFCKCGCQ